MRDESCRNLKHIPQNLSRFISVFLATAVASHRDFLRQGGKRRARVGRTQHNLMRVGQVSFVMESVILAEHDPDVIAVFRHLLSSSHRTREWALTVVCSPEDFERVISL